MEHSITVKSTRARPQCVVRLSPEAARVLEKLERSTGQSKQYLASQLIIQGSAFIKPCPEECWDCTRREQCSLAEEF